VEVCCGCNTCMKMAYFYKCLPREHCSLSDTCVKMISFYKCLTWGLCCSSDTCVKIVYRVPFLMFDLGALMWFQDGCEDGMLFLMFNLELCCRSETCVNLIYLFKCLIWKLCYRSDTCFVGLNFNISRGNVYDLWLTWLIFDS
jgi:hypothetical protein